MAPSLLVAPVARSAAALAAAAAISACNRESRPATPVPAPETGPTVVSVSELYPGAPAPAPPDPRVREYEGVAYHISNGQRYFQWFNCVGCHSNGGGGIGPALMDDKWRYGGRIEQIYASIVEGRPNGMPAFREKIPEQQVWQIAAYVRSLTGNVDRLAAPSRPEGLRSIPPINNLDRQPIKGDPAAVQAGGG